MESEITDPNCIVKAFQNNNISIIKDEDNKYFFNQNKTFVEGHKSNFFKTIYENIGAIIPR